MPSIDFSRYKWRRDDGVPNRFKREVGGGELYDDILNFHKQGEQNLFLGTYIQLNQPFEFFETSNFIDLLRKAWISIRWDVPTVASQTLHEHRDGSARPASLLSYTLASNRAEVEAWARETVILKDGFKDLDTLRYDIVKGVIPEKDLVPQTFLYCLPLSPVSFGLLLYTSHVPFDGTGVKVLMSRFLEHLSRYLSDPQYDALEVARRKWGEEDVNLIPSSSEVLREHEPAEYDAKGNLVKPETPGEPREGLKYTETLNQVVSDLSRGAQVAHQFKSVKQPLYDQNNDTPLTRRIGHTFTAEQSKQIIDGCRNAPDKLTVNHLALGSLGLLVVLDNPPEPGSPNVVFLQGLVDGRQKLAKRYRGPLDYPGYCLGMSSIQVPVNIADKYAGKVADNLKSTVLDFAQSVKKEYARQSAFPALLAIVNEEVELMLLAPPAPPRCGPSFGGDGRGSIHLKPKYPQQGDTVIEVTDFFVGLGNTDPGPFFRITEWNGRIMLSADYNQKAVEPDVVEGWMKKWAELILTIT